MDVKQERIEEIKTYLSAYTKDSNRLDDLIDRRIELCNKKGKTQIEERTFNIMQPLRESPPLGPVPGKEGTRPPERAQDGNTTFQKYGSMAA